MTTKFIIPTEEGSVTLEEGLKAACEANKWTLIAPDGRVWMHTDLMILLAVISRLMTNDDLKFGVN